jgi:lipoyl-dependent peroxiredoxin
MAEIKRRATATWIGNGAEGRGQLTSASGALNQTPFSFYTRFKDEEGRSGTNPEELVAAAHAGCFSMKLSFVLTAAGFVPDLIDTRGSVSLADGAVTGSHLELRATVKGISDEVFQKLAEEAKANCPISKMLAVPVTLDATLVTAES